MLLSTSVLLGVVAVVQGQSQAYGQCMKSSRLEESETDKENKVVVKVGAVLQLAYLAMFALFLGMTFPSLPSCFWARDVTNLLLVNVSTTF